MQAHHTMATLTSASSKLATPTKCFDKHLMISIKIYTCTTSQVTCQGFKQDFVLGRLLLECF